MIFLWVIIFSLSSSYGQSAFNHYRIILTDINDRTKKFKIDVLQNKNPEGYERLEAYLKKGVEIDPHGNPEIGVVVGDIIRTQPTQTHHFHFRYDVKTIRWNDFASELCDGQFIDVETYLDQWLLQGQFCPWATRSMVVKIVKNFRVIWKRELESLSP